MAIFLRGIIGVLAVCCLAACGSTEKTGEDNGGDDNESIEPAISNEKIDASSHQNLAPGTAKVHIELKNTEDEVSGGLWNSVVKQVLGYGAATPPLSVGTELAIQTKGYFSNVSTDPADVMARDKIICIIQHHESPGGAANQAWRLVDIVDQSNN